ncbi:hypothetical protein BDK51DRAFT_37378 [Blyttiomyces helicus]|uniref:Ankyrin repeat-containing domain protein n=1 Tax=Blyttiomyces helicus TaxID=388810 RepID=A0A4P9WHV9_9FUNG|nr:hypothetical protein BDK51DRAFT_37378 [Blyttiomyces helicus]|eukprot:RKO91982.1 hypothetical protein BDK51DRAFT_37378 [Blyttiomyces helicus]
MKVFQKPLDKDDSSARLWIMTPLDSEALNVAAKNGHLELVKYLFAIGKPFPNAAMDSAATYGHMDFVKWSSTSGTTMRGLLWTEGLLKLQSLMHWPITTDPISRQGYDQCLHEQPLPQLQFRRKFARKSSTRRGQEGQDRRLPPRHRVPGSCDGEIVAQKVKFIMTDTPELAPRGKSKKARVKKQHLSDDHAEKTTTEEATAGEEDSKRKKRPLTKRKKKRPLKKGRQCLLLDEQRQKGKNDASAFIASTGPSTDPFSESTKKSQTMMTDPECLAIVKFHKTRKVGGAPNGGQALKKADCYKALLKYVPMPTSRGEAGVEWKDSMQGRTKYGLIPDDYHKWLTTVEKMVKKKCL